MKYLSCTETSKLIRQSLKEAFPGIKFSVRSSTYSGGASISVSWTDGPNASQVEAVVAVFKGSYFDSSIDYKGSIYHMMDGEQVSLGADFIFCRREYSSQVIQSAIDRVYRLLKGNFTKDGIQKPTAEAYNRGELYGIALSGYHYHGRSIQTEISAALAKHTFRIKTEKSKTAAKIFVTHDDGYGQSGWNNVLGV